MYRKALLMVPCLLFLLIVATHAIGAAPSSGWAPALSLESVPGTSQELNTPSLEGCPMLAPDGRRLYFASNRPGGLGGIDIWTAQRQGSGLSFGAPANLGAPINSTDPVNANDFCPSPQRDGRTFLFVSNRAGGCGGSDIYITQWDPISGWQMPRNLGCTVNSSADEQGPVVSFAEVGTPALYFSSTRAGMGGSDIYVSRMTGLWSFGPPELVPGINTSVNEGQPFVRQDGREILFFSNRNGSVGGNDIWSASRDSAAEPWRTPENLGNNVNTASNESRPSLSFDGNTLLFGSDRQPGEGASDLYYSTRR